MSSIAHKEVSLEKMDKIKSEKATEGEDFVGVAPSVADAGQAAAKMIEAMFKAVNDPNKEGGGLSFSMAPQADGTVVVSGSSGLAVDSEEEDETEDPRYCEDCDKSPCFYFQKEEEIANYLEYLGDSDFTNKEKRYRMYRYLSTIYEGSLGQYKRKELPRCLVAEVRDCFPKAPGEEYVGFKESEQANED